MSDLDRFEGIPGLESWTKVEPVKKGWSRDDKYYVDTGRGEKLLVRVSDIADLPRKEKEYQALQRLSGIPILMSRPVAFGTCNAGKNAFTVLTWIDGVPADEHLPGLPPKNQYELGYIAGRALREIHTIPAPDRQPDWAERFNRKINRNIRNHEACQFKLPFAHKIISYIDSNRHLLQSRPQVFQHGDYHCGNMIITPSGELGVIDFNRLDYGDPWEEFNRIVWCAAVSPHFASGRISGYFAAGDRPGELVDVPSDFFKLMALYIGSNMLSSVPWAIPFGQSEVDTMVTQAWEVMSWYDDFRTYVPGWYVE